MIKKKNTQKKERCQHPEHSPPGHIVLKPGTYTHTCPSCGMKQSFTIPAYDW